MNAATQENARLGNHNPELYRDINEFAKDVGLQAEHMITAFKLEQQFHTALLEEPSHEKRLSLYRDIYTRVFEIYGFKPEINLNQDYSVKLPIIEMFRSKLTGGDILDAGCGTGQFLLACAKTVQPNYCLGIDVFAQDLKIPELKLEFRNADITKFSIPEKFDVVMSDNVLEHLAPVDLKTHLASIKAALKPKGSMIVLTPNRLFGPWDVTRILDYSYSGRTPAQGTHVNEMTHAQLVGYLKEAGFTQIRSLMPRSRHFHGFRKIQLPASLMVRLESINPLVRLLQNLNKKPFLQAFEIGLIAS
jgi:2-polyprenyl-3-methyl-5-hydroxy-6-metoxy-1,4-benzoquinol methylase